MKKARVILAAVLLFAVVGGALAFKAKARLLWYFNGTTWVQILNPNDCTGTTSACTTTTAEGQPPVALFTQPLPGIYVPVFSKTTTAP